MGLSNYLPSSRISQSGVCTSTTRPASPYEGQMIYETDTNRVLVYDNSAWVMIADTDTPPGLELVKTQTVGSAVSSVTVNNCFSSSYDAYRLVISSVNCSTSNTAMYLQMTASGTASTASYNFGIPRVDIANGAVAATYSQSGTQMWVSITSSSTSASMDILDPYAAAYTKFPNLARYELSSGYFGAGAGQHEVATSYDGIKVYPSSGTMTGGTIRVYGYRNSI